MPETYQVFSDVRDVTLAGMSLAGVTRIAMRRRRRILRATGDEDLHERVARAGAWSVDGEVHVLDPAAAMAAAALHGDLTFTWREPAGTDRVVTVAGVSVVSAELAAGHRTAGEAKMSFLAQSPDGGTDPVTVI